MKYIFEIKIRNGHTVEEYVEAWRNGSVIIQKYSGARGTRLYRKINESDKLLAIADWESKTSRDSAMKALAESDAETQRVWKAHNEFGEFTKIGAFDETDWQVLPA